MLQDKSSYVEQRAFFLSYFFHAQMTDTIANGNFCARCLCGHIDCPIEHNFSYVVDAPPSGQTAPLHIENNSTVLGISQDGQCKFLSNFPFRKQKNPRQAARMARQIDQ